MMAAAVAYLWAIGALGMAIWAAEGVGRVDYRDVPVVLLWPALLPVLVVIGLVQMWRADRRRARR